MKSEDAYNIILESIQKQFLRLNTIPRLDEYVIRLMVLNERMLGYIYPDKTFFVVALEVVLFVVGVDLLLLFMHRVNPVADVTF